MKTQLLVVASITLLLAGCQGGPPVAPSPAPGRGALEVRVTPNPIVAQANNDDTYTFPFEAVVRETGGRPVRITNVSATVLLGGALQLGRESWDAQKIQSMGYPTSVGPNGELRYRFTPRKEVPDDRLFGGVSAELRVEGVDDQGNAANATTTVTVTR
jgi:hypothetical protein